MPLTTTFAGASARAFGLMYDQGELLTGISLVKPSSVVAVGTGSSATIEPNGSVTFSACTSLSVNDAFTTNSHSYMIVISSSTTGTIYQYRMRVSDADDSTASSYVSQELSIKGVNETGTRTTSNLGYLTQSNGAVPDGITAYIFGPFLTQQTAVRTVTFSGDNGRTISDYGSTHSQSTSYTGITIIMSVGSISGTLAVYELED